MLLLYFYFMGSSTPWIKCFTSYFFLFLTSFVKIYFYHHSNLNYTVHTGIFVFVVSFLHSLDFGKIAQGKGKS